jgi:hypothetical protein
MRIHSLPLIALFYLSTVSLAQQPSPRPHPKARPATSSSLLRVCGKCVHAYEDFLASDALNGRGSATHDEFVAATYLASQLEQFGIAPAGDHAEYIQSVPLIRRKYAIPAQLRFTDPDTRDEITWKHGLEMLLLHTGPSEVTGPLQKVVFGKDTPIQRGAFVLLQAEPDGPIPNQEQALKLSGQGAAGVMIPENPGYGSYWQQLGAKLFAGKIELPDSTGEQPLSTSTLIMLNDDATAKLEKIPDGTMISLKAPLEKTEKLQSHNVLGLVRGSDPSLSDQIILFSAHYDHLGVGEAVNGDSIYNGADDDASGVSAILELARVLASNQHPRRSVLFAFFGSEELGELGSDYFRDHSPVPIKQIIVNVEFEMIGRPDPKIAPNAMFLSGWERSNLGPALAKHGAHLVADPHPEQHFFERSDNYALAKRGVVAQTISSFGLHEDYHRPSDDIAHLDLKHMEDAIQSLLAPMEWLVNSKFKPQWNPGGKP